MAKYQQWSQVNATIDGMLKRRLFAALAMEGKSFTQWLTEQAEAYLKEAEAEQYRQRDAR